jgi:TolB-like protein
VTEPSHAVFLSYASQDAEAAQRISEALRAAGIEVWFDQHELRGGEAWDRQITKQIRECALFLAVISAHTDERSEGYFRREWRAAVERMRDLADDRTFLLPVVIDATREDTARVPDRFREFQWIRLPAGDTPPAAVERIQRLLSLTEPISPAHHAVGAVSAAGAVQEHGIVRDRKQSRWLWPASLAFALAVIAGGAYFALDRFVLSKRSTPSSTAITDKSIAVLPFADLSETHDQEYFSDGLAEELRDLLAQVPDLKVPGRAASFYFKGRQVSLSDIAKALGVGYVLEGSVRKAGTKVRVAVELVRADTGFELWSEHFDRDLKDIFDVQSEIATAVVQALRIRLLSHTLVSARQTSNVEAYDQYLIGRQLYSLGTVDSDREAIAHLDRAIALDPIYAAAYAQRALTTWNLSDDLGREETDEEYRQRKQDMEHAIEFGPQMSDGYALRGLDRLLTADWTGAREDLEKAISLNPQDGQGWRFLARYYATQHNLTKAIETAGRAAELDHFDPWPLFYRARIELAASRPGPARADLEKALELSHGSPAVLIELALLDAAEGAIGTAAQAAQRIQSNSTDSYRVPLDAVVRCAQGERSSAVRALDRWIDSAKGLNPQYAIVAYVRCGENEKAVTVLERYLSAPLYRITDDTVECLAYYAEFAPLRAIPRYRAMLRKLNLPE